MDPANSWSEEKQSAWLYRALAEAERDSRIADLFRALADAAEDQARTWEKAAIAAGQATTGTADSPSAVRSGGSVNASTWAAVAVCGVLAALFLTGGAGGSVEQDRGVEVAGGVQR